MSRPHASRERTPAGLLLASPALLGLLLFLGVPFVLAVVLAFSDLRLGSPLPVEFVGLRQFGRIFRDPGFLRALWNNVVFAAAVVPLQTALALGLALLLDRGLRGTLLFRTLFFMPVVFPMSLVAMIWIVIYAPGPDGAMNALLERITFGAWQPRDLLHDGATALPALMLMSIWQGVGFQMVIVLAGLQSIAAEQYEAAALDGAGPWQRFVHVTLPGLRRALVFVALVTTILAFRLFDQVQIMTRGGPRDATTVVMYEAVQAVFTRQQVARGCAMTVVFFVFVAGLTWLQRRLVRGWGGPR